MQSFGEWVPIVKIKEVIVLVHALKFVRIPMYVDIERCLS